ncbi:unnamed protein product [Linum trigynum]|uniref:Uncharacterized protein n=1 Tax=Linum trigynum TaxID=586398 RepID=A0AAV2GFF8_9ROSI
MGHNMFRRFKTRSSDHRGESPENQHRGESRRIPFPIASTARLGSVLFVAYTILFPSLIKLLMKKQLAQISKFQCGYWNLFCL